MSFSEAFHESKRFLRGRPDCSQREFCLLLFCCRKEIKGVQWFLMKLSKRILALMAVLFFVTSSAIGDEIHDAAAGGDLEKVKALLKENPKLVFSKPVGADAPFPGFTPLHRAAQLGHKDVAELLLAKGANVNDRANTGDTPLHAAALNSHMDVAELLLAKGADVNANPI